MTKFTDVFVSKKNKVISLSKLLSLRGKIDLHNLYCPKCQCKLSLVTPHTPSKAPFLRTSPGAVHSKDCPYGVEGKDRAVIIHHGSEVHQLDLSEIISRLHRRFKETDPDNKSRQSNGSDVSKNISTSSRKNEETTVAIKPKTVVRDEEANVVSKEKSFSPHVPLLTPDQYKERKGTAVAVYGYFTKIEAVNDGAQYKLFFECDQKTSYLWLNEAFFQGEIGLKDIINKFGEHLKKSSICSDG